MISENLNSIVKEMNQQGVIISFNGSFTQNIIEEMGEAIKKYLEEDKTEDNDETRSYDVFSVYIELSQNIKNYFQKKMSSNLENEFFKLTFESIIVIGKEKNDYYVCSGNIIDNTDIKELKQSIEQVNSLNKEELRKYFKEKLKSTRNNEYGAGLGLIDMVKKSKNPLEYLFVERNDKYSFFILKANI
jgi:hypothetical protein